MRSGAGGVRDVTISFATTLYIQIVNIVTGLLAARLLMPEGRGELAALMLWPGLVAELGCLALSDALLYRLASNAAAPRVLFGTIIAMTVALCAVLIPIGFLILPFAMAGQSSRSSTNHGCRPCPRSCIRARVLRSSSCSAGVLPPSGRSRSPRRSPRALPASGSP